MAAFRVLSIVFFVFVGITICSAARTLLGLGAALEGGVGLKGEIVAGIGEHGAGYGSGGGEGGGAGYGAAGGGHAGGGG
ncbi:hypothetical protein FRX31_025750, partial [Thalictrum thalictroides]